MHFVNTTIFCSCINKINCTATKSPPHSLHLRSHRKSSKCASAKAICGDKLSRLLYCSRYCNLVVAITGVAFPLQSLFSGCEIVYRICIFGNKTVPAKCTFKAANLSASDSVRFRAANLQLQFTNYGNDRRWYTNDEVPTKWLKTHHFLEKSVTHRQAD